MMLITNATCLFDPKLYKKGGFLWFRWGAKIFINNNLIMKYHVDLCAIKMRDLYKCWSQMLLMGVTRMHYLDEINTNDEVIPNDEEISHHWRGKESHSMMSASSLSSYETSKIDRWEPIKSPIIGLEALLRKALTLQRLATKITYIKPLH